MESITLSEIVTIVGIISSLWIFSEKISKSINGALDKKLDPLKKDVNLSLRVQAQMLNHIIDGNSIEKLKDLRKEMEKELINRN